MISDAEYKRRNGVWWTGKRVRSLREMETRLQVLPVGMLFTVQRKHKGFSLKSDACTCCGASARVADVPPSWLELVE